MLIQFWVNLKINKSPCMGGCISGQDRIYFLSWYNKFQKIVLKLTEFQMRWDVKCWWDFLFGFMFYFLFLEWWYSPSYCSYKKQCGTRQTTSWVWASMCVRNKQGKSVLQYFSYSFIRARNNWGNNTSCYYLYNNSGCLSVCPSVCVTIST